MWKWLPPAALDTSQDHLPRPPVAWSSYPIPLLILQLGIVPLSPFAGCHPCLKTVSFRVHP